MSRLAPSSALVATPSFSSLKEYLIAQTGLAYYANKDQDLAQRLLPRLMARGLPDCGGYLALLRDPQDGPAELDALIEELTIGETFFFRHTELFSALRTTVLPDLIARNRSQRRLRIWSAGCSIGAEPYSLSILLRRELASELAGWDITLIGTDINREFLTRASAGVFEEWALRATPEEVRRDCFTFDGRSWLLHHRFKEGISFQYHNLVTHHFPSLLNNLFAFDLILCRNVLIYFSPDLIQQVLAGLHQSLVEGGWLLVGHAEPNIQFFRAFHTVNSCPGVVLYQKTVPTTIADFRFQIEDCKPPPPPPSQVDPPRPLICNLQSAICNPSPAPDLAEIRTLADRGAWEQALEGCRALLGTARLDPLVHLYHGLVLEQAGQHHEAEAALRRSLYLDRRFVLAHYYLGLLLLKGHRPADAARSFRNVLGLLAPPAFPPEHVFHEADGITAAELARLARMNLDILEGT